ncbi:MULTISPECIES: DsbA family oxidoreductase [Cellulophaga]|uniref:DSBA oxidoreductase n=1 Tax=Cellulophaga lytica (strain ATCC 23178 / DSM 7489 / JCM 8516 / NBRC 14961 / NCIMB 1423 / VKM B-1433 / Cy l20) TaxID=867900 RepID=F0RI84_CELLC|nr:MULTISPECIES: DsbA family oxidoreductase [Cellulophaga]ADY28210.1 DSBA oxidoreductase [Cellulophaga lytica DSM 7489]TVZ09223.1 putative DsbA family dithiol-disulfide isomerase [Cellulophaga sp. RHA_52]WQG77608.1 DsbA family oxidoreductase [Cellulophaga lytica]
MSNKIKIDVVSDVVCPWCAIGYKRLEQAITEMGIQDKIELEWQPFQLNPNMPTNGQDLEEHITEKYGSTPEQQQESQERMTDFGAELGFKFDYFKGMRMANTFDAHVLLEYAKENGKQTQLKMRLMNAFFGERKDVSNRDILKQELETVGLNTSEAFALLDSQDKRTKVKSDEDYWKSLGVNSVPTVVFNRKSALTGAQPVAVYKQVLTELLES